MTAPSGGRDVLRDPIVVVRRLGVVEYADGLDERTVEVFTRHLRAAWAELDGPALGPDAGAMRRALGDGAYVKRLRRSVAILASGLDIVVPYLREHDDGMSAEWMSVIGVAESCLGVAQGAVALPGPDATGGA